MTVAAMTLIVSFLKNLRVGRQGRRYLHFDRYLHCDHHQSFDADGINLIIEKMASVMTSYWKIDGGTSMTSNIFMAGKTAELGD